MDTIQSNPGFRTFEIVKTGVVTQPALSVSSSAGNWTTDSDTTQVSHGLGYKPLVMAYWTNEVSGSGVSSQLPRVFFGGSTGATWGIQGIRILVNNSVVLFESRVSAYGNTSSGIVEGVITYYLLRESVR